MRLLKRHRLAKGMTQGDIARKLQVKSATVSGWENGLWLPSPSIFPKLARILEINPMELTQVISPEPQRAAS